MPTPTDSIPTEPGTRITMPALARVCRYESSSSGAILEAYINASFAAELFCDGQDRFVFIHALAKEHGHLLPNGKPNYSVTRVPSAMNPAYMVGETMMLRCTWPPESELKR